MNRNVNIIEEEKIEGLWTSAKKICSDVEKVNNLILSGYFNLNSESNNSFINDYSRDASLFQLPNVPKELKLNHGKYLHTNDKNGMEFLIEELKKKENSNRACWSLLNMQDIIQSGDHPIPSFMSLQANLCDQSNSIRLSAYFRALEVHNFLPINLAEIWNVAIKINENFGYKYNELSLVIQAFNAYSDPTFNCLKKAKIDTLTSNEINGAIFTTTKAKSWLKDMLIDKRDHKESNIEISGMNYLSDSIKVHKKTSDCRELYSDDIFEELDIIIKEMNKFNEIVSKISYGEQIKIQYKIIKTRLDDLIKKI